MMHPDTNSYLARHFLKETTLQNIFFESIKSSILIFFIFIFKKLNKAAILKTLKLKIKRREPGMRTQNKNSFLKWYQTASHFYINVFYLHFQNQNREFKGFTRLPRNWFCQEAENKNLFSVTLMLALHHGKPPLANGKPKPTIEE